MTVDRMAEIRDQIAGLETEFAELRAKLISGEIDKTGQDWIAVVTEQETRRISVRDAEKVLPEGLFESLVSRSKQTTVRLQRRGRNVASAAFRPPGKLVS